MKKLETKDFKFTVEAQDDEAGTFTGYASVFGTVDSYGDVVVPGAFKKTLKDKPQFPILWSHNITEPIGVGTGSEDETGLRLDGQLNLDVQRAREIRSLMRQGAVDGLSIGFQTVKDGVDKSTGNRLLKEIKLWEVSAVVFGANPDALVDSVKSDDIAAEVEEPALGATPAPEPVDVKGEPVASHSLKTAADAVAEFRKSLTR